MKVALDSEGYGFYLTEAGVKQLVKKKKKTSQPWNEKFIKDNKDKVFFRTDEDVISMLSERCSENYTEYKFSIEEFELPSGMDINDPRIKIIDPEEFNMVEFLIIELAATIGD